MQNSSKNADMGDLSTSDTWHAKYKIYQVHINDTEIKRLTFISCCTPLLSQPAPDRSWGRGLISSPSAQQNAANWALFRHGWGEDGNLFNTAGDWGGANKRIMCWTSGQYNWIFSYRSRNASFFSIFKMQNEQQDIEVEEHEQYPLQETFAASTSIAQRFFYGSWSPQSRR